MSHGLRRHDVLPSRLRIDGGLNTEIKFNAEIKDPDDASHIEEVVAEIRAIPAYREMERVPVAV